MTAYKTPVDPDDVSTNPSDNTTLAEIVAERLANPSRRGLFQGVAATAALGFVGLGTTALSKGAFAQVAAPAAGAAAPAAAALRRPATLGFKAVAKSMTDAIVVPEGYTARAIYRLGDPLAANVAAYKNDATPPPRSLAALVTTTTASTISAWMPTAATRPPATTAVSWS